jgi:hypothetical protein
MPRSAPTTNPFRYGDLALDEAFTDRAHEVEELKSDMRNGQNVVVFAPRRYGKTSLIWRASQDLIRKREVLVAQVDLMKAPTRERFAAKLASSIYEDVASPLLRARDRAMNIFRGLRVAPAITLDTDGRVGFTFQAGHSSADIHATLEHLLELPAHLAAERDRRVAIVFDEFQEIAKIDRQLLPLMRSVFQEQPEVSHVYLGSKRHMMEEIFNDENEPFWRSAKHMELGVIPPKLFARFIRSRFTRTGRTAGAAVVDALLAITHAHPYGTQELAYALWEVTPEGAAAGDAELAQALARVLHSENAHFQSVWGRASRAQRVVMEALARDPGRPPFATAYRRTHNLPANSTVQRALDTLVQEELVERDGVGYRIAEPFLAEWILRGDL